MTDFKSGNFRKNRVKKRPTRLRHQEIKTTSNLFSHSLIVSSNLYLQDMGSEIALSIMVQEFTRLENGTLLHAFGNSWALYLSIVAYIKLYFSIVVYILYKGLASLSQKCAISDIHVHL